MKQIPLTRGQFALVDAADYEWLMQWKWHAWFNPCTNSFYALRTVTVGGRDRSVRLHRIILGLEYGDRRTGDHKNGNTLDCQRENLRIADYSQNNCNARRRSDNSSGFKGVTARNDKWIAQIQIRGRKVHIGMYQTPTDAYAAYCEAAGRLHGEFARLA